MDPLVDQDKLRNALSGQSMELCNFLQNVVAITYIFGLQQPTFLLCNFLHLYFATNTVFYSPGVAVLVELTHVLVPDSTQLPGVRFPEFCYPAGNGRLLPLTVVFLNESLK